MEIRHLKAADWDTWLDMWSQYCAFYGESLEARVTRHTWERILDKASAINGLIAIDVNGQAVGICHYICHPNTWSDRTVCYLEDLFTLPAGRRKGVATAFINTLTAQGKSENWSRLYWHTKQDNLAAQAVYDRLAVKSDFLRYDIAF